MNRAISRRLSAVPSADAAGPSAGTQTRAAGTHTPPGLSAACIDSRLQPARPGHEHATRRACHSAPTSRYFMDGWRRPTRVQPPAPGHPHCPCRRYTVLRCAALCCGVGRPQKAPAFGAPPSHLSLSARPPPPQAAVTGVRWINWKLDPAPMRLFNRRCGRAPHLTSTRPCHCDTAAVLAQQQQQQQRRCFFQRSNTRVPR